MAKKSNKHPTGIVTFLFTDIEGSTKLAQEFPDSLSDTLEKHNRILRRAVEFNHGFIFQIIGDAFCCAFKNPGDAIKAAHEAQLKLNSEKWIDTQIKVRIGIHCGNADWNGERYIRIYLTRTNTTYNVCRSRWTNTCFK